MSGSLWTGLKWTFFASVLIGAWWSLRSSGHELSEAINRVSIWQVASAQVLTLCGVTLTGLVWRTSLEAFVEREPVLVSVPSFFIAQLGKYIPGGVWSFAVQGALGTRQGRSPRVPVAAALLFVSVHVASGLVLAGLVGWWSDVPRWLVAGALPLGILGLAPALLGRLGERLSGDPCDWSWRRTFDGGVLMVLVWCCYSASLAVLTPEPRVTLVVTLGTAFAVAFAVGVAVPIAPAGLGARDGVLLLLIAPILGAGPAGVVTVLARLAHTLADFLLAGASWLLVRILNERRRAIENRRAN